MKNREIAEFWPFIARSVDRLVALLDGLSEKELNWRPLESANSLYALAVHTMGNVEENLLGVLCGQPTQRQREAEFAAQGASGEPVRERWRDLRDRVAANLAQLPPGVLDEDRQHPRRGRLTGREVLIVVARHATEHLGQAALTRDLIQSESSFPENSNFLGN